MLTIARFWYLRSHSVQRDMKEAILPLSQRLHASDFFRRPRNEDVRFSFWIVQYGIIWYAINLPIMHLARFDGKRFTYLMMLLDTIFVWFCFNLGLVGALLYVGINTINLFKAPWNISIIWITLLGIVSWIFLALAPVAKLPIGIPTKVWGHVRQAIFYQKNPYYYGLLGIFWIFVFWRTVLPWLFAGTWLGQIASFGI